MSRVPGKRARPVLKGPGHGDVPRLPDIWGVLAELEAAGLIVLADKGYQGSACAKVPYKGKNKPASQKEANKAHAKLRSPGERANAQLRTGSGPGGFSASSGAAPGAPDSSPRPSMFADPRGKRRMKRLTVRLRLRRSGLLRPVLATRIRHLHGSAAHPGASHANDSLAHRAFTRNFSASAPVASRWPREYRPRGESSPQARY